MPVSNGQSGSNYTIDALINMRKALVSRSKDSQSSLADRFLLPPFSVLDARQGYWQKRKRMWLDLGIQSEIGRGGNSDSSKKGADGRKTDSIPGGGGGPNSKHRLFSQEIADRQRKRLAKAFNCGMNPTPQTNSGSWSIEDDYGSGTSIFDPVICELVYRWFCPLGGKVLDPFAGGSVRGVVAGRLKRRYFGIDLSEQQITANRVQWNRIRARDISTDEVVPITLPSPLVEDVSLQIDDEEMISIRVVRDDLLQGGTKRRALSLWLPKLAVTSGKRKFVYAGPAYGFAQVALALTCRDFGFQAFIIVPERKELHPRSQVARDAGATIVQVPFGRLNVLEAQAKEFAIQNEAVLLPFGMDSPEFISCLTEVIRGSSIEKPHEVWCVAGSGVLARALKEAWPEAELHAIQIGTSRMDLPAGTKVYKAPEKFEEDAFEPPPFPSCTNYDAKAWRFLKDNASQDALFWNVAADRMIEESPSLEDQDTSLDQDPSKVVWIVGDSRAVLQSTEQDFDLVFSCPPYADLERYSNDPRDLSTMDYDRFINEYASIIALSCSKLKNNRFACFVVGDVRDRATGYYRSFPGDTIKAFRNAGLELYNEAILVTSVGSLPIRVGYQFSHYRKLGKTHQNVLVFVKGDAKLASDECGEVDVLDMSMPELIVDAIAVCSKDVVGTFAEKYINKAEVSIIQANDLEAYLICDILRGRALAEDKPLPRAWLGTESGWRSLRSADELTYVIGNTPYLSKDLFPDAPGPVGTRPEVRKLRGS